MPSIRGAHLFLLLALVLPFLSVHLAAAAGFIEGRVMDRRGEPIAGAGVSVYLEAIGGGFEKVQERRELLHTGPGGRFRAEGLQGGRRYYLTVRHTGYVDASVPGVEAPTAEPLKIEMRVARNLSGQVVGPEGEPVAGASLAWRREVRESDSIGYSFGSSSLGGAQPLGVTGADGRFRVSG